MNLWVVFVFIITEISVPLGRSSQPRVMIGADLCLSLCTPDGLGPAPF